MPTYRAYLISTHFYLKIEQQNNYKVDEHSAESRWKNEIMCKLCHESNDIWNLQISLSKGL